MRHVCFLVGVLVALGGGARLPASPYTYHTYETIVADLATLEADHPGLVQVFTAQDAFPTVVSTDDDDGTALSHWVIRLTNEATGFDKPEVLLVGTQHGDEAVSPEALLALMDLLTDSYGSHPWLTELLDRREIYVVPLANPWGHRQTPFKQRQTVDGATGSGFEDMNRDHPYDRCDRVDPEDCGFFDDEDTLSTNGARTLHELARRHLFRVMLDYHGGIELILHPWGSPEHVPLDTAPDHVAFETLGARMSTFGGPYSGFYPVFTANDGLGAVHGPLDDSGYATSWDTAIADPAYPVAGWQALSYTIEISDAKMPPVGTLGGNADLLTPGGTEDGYVPKNVRIGLAAIDIAEPYVVWSNRSAVPTTVDVGQPITVEWQVRGCFDVDETRVRAGTDPDPLNSFTIETATQSQTTGEPCFEPPTTFSAEVSFGTPGNYWLTPTARVDQALLSQSNPNPNVAPQSFVVRSRTETGLIASEAVDASEVNTVVGQIDWGAAPLQVVVVEGEIFADGFESGDIQAWSLTRP